jgi:hypothetical protein
VTATLQLQPGKHPLLGPTVTRSKLRMQAHKAIKNAQRLLDKETYYERGRVKARKTQARNYAAIEKWDAERAQLLARIDDPERAKQAAGRWGELWDPNREARAALPRDVCLFVASMPSCSCQRPPQAPEC